MPNFDEAIRATEEMFANEQAEVVPPVEEIPVEEPVEEVPTEEETPAVEEEEVPPTTPEDTTLDDAINTAEIAAQTAQQKDAELQQVLQELEALKAQNEQMQGTIAELSQKNEENLIEEVLEPPVLDINGLAFASEDEVKQAHADFAQKMSDYNRQQLMKELAPTLEYAKKGMQEAEKNEVLSSLSQVPELAGISEMIPQLDKIIANNRWLQSDDMDMSEKYINAYAIARGVNAINTPPPEPPKELTSEELMKLYDENPTFQELVEKKRIETIKQSQQVPPFSASSGAVNAALNIKEKPKTLEEASEATRKMWGLM